MSEEIKDKLNNLLDGKASVLGHEEIRPGVHQLHIDPKGKELAFLNGRGSVSPMKPRLAEQASTLTRDYLRRIDLDLMSQDPLTSRPDLVYNRAINYYRNKGPYGSTVDVLTNFAAKGFRNDVEDPKIKLFYDTWNREVGFQEVLEKIFLDFFRVGMVRTFKLLGKFEPRIANQAVPSGASKFSTKGTAQRLLEFQEFAAAKKVWSKAYVPIAYTILDPRLIIIQGPLLFDQTETFLKPEAFKEVRQLLSKASSSLTQEQKDFISSLPRDFKENIKLNKPIKLPSDLVGKCDFRKQDYERYPFPRITRAYDALDYKEELQKADFSTLDGVTNYILKITIGNDQHPVTDQSQLETIAKLFDTTSKGFDIVWNHTLDIEKITFPEIGEILGQDKYEQVNDDLSQSFGVSRALLDGDVQGSPKALDLAAKSTMEEVNYARRCVLRWAHKEYEAIAIAMGFDRYPEIRFDDMALKDELMMMSIVQGMIDRRIISYQTGIEKLGFDYQTELAHMQEEKNLVLAGDLGILGSPYNPKTMPPVQEPTKLKKIPEGNVPHVPLDELVKVLHTNKSLEDMIKRVVKESQNNIQPTQRTPKGTPSEGRPRKGGKGKPRQKSVVPVIKPPKPKL